jgi:hypothetical protein
MRPCPKYGRDGGVTSYSEYQEYPDRTKKSYYGAEDEGSFPIIIEGP